MLAHFEHFDFTALLEDLNVWHVLFLYLLDRNFLARLQMSSHFDEAKLTFTKCFFKFVEVENVSVIHHFLQFIHPVLLLLCRIEEENVDLIWGDADRNRVVLLLCLRACLSRGIIITGLNEARSQWMHVSMRSIALLLVDVDLVALEGRKMGVELFGCVWTKVAFAIKALKLGLLSLEGLKNRLSLALALDYAAAATRCCLNLSGEGGITEILQFLINLLFAEFLEVRWLRTRSISLAHRYRWANLVKLGCLVRIVHIGIRISGELQWLPDCREFLWTADLNVAVPD